MNSNCCLFQAENIDSSCADMNDRAQLELERQDSFYTMSSEALARVQDVQASTSSAITDTLLPRDSEAKRVSNASF